jgi:putative transposase
MSRRGNPWDNATCESFMKTLKCELEEIYNQKRLQSSLGYCPPAEFERRQSSRPMLVAAVAQEAV